MTFPILKGSTLVDMANDASLLLYCVVIGDQDGPPQWVQLTADGNNHIPASRITLVREQGECCASLWARVLSAIRELKRPRGLQHGILVNCCVTAPPKNVAERDSRFNLERALWHDVERERDSMRRVQALCTLADLSMYTGKVPLFQ